MPFDPQLGLAEETTPGTAVTVTRFYEYVSETLQHDINPQRFMGLRPNKATYSTSNLIQGGRNVTGDVVLPVMTKGMGLIVKHMLGGIATTTPTGATLARDHTGTVGTLDADSLTIQKGVPKVGSTTQAFTYAGCKVASWELSWEANSDDPLMLTLSLDGRSETTATALAAASYPAASGFLPFSYVTGALTLGGVAFDCKSVSLQGENNLAVDRRFIGSTSKKEQFDVGIRSYTGTLTGEFMGTTEYARFISGDTSAALVLTAQSSVFIEGAIPYVFEVTCPNLWFNGETPKVGGRELVDQPLPFEALDGGAGAITIRVRNGDAAP